MGDLERLGISNNEDLQHIYEDKVLERLCDIAAGMGNEELAAVSKCSLGWAPKVAEIVKTKDIGRIVKESFAGLPYSEIVIGDVLRYDSNHGAMGIVLQHAGETIFYKWDPKQIKSCLEETNNGDVAKALDQDILHTAALKCEKDSEMLRVFIENMGKVVYRAKSEEDARRTAEVAAIYSESPEMFKVFMETAGEAADRTRKDGVVKCIADVAARYEKNPAIFEVAMRIIDSTLKVDQMIFVAGEKGEKGAGIVPLSYQVTSRASSFDSDATHRIAEKYEKNPDLLWAVMNYIGKAAFWCGKDSGEAVEMMDKVAQRMAERHENPKIAHDVVNIMGYALETEDMDVLRRMYKVAEKYEKTPEPLKAAMQKIWLAAWFEKFKKSPCYRGNEPAYPHSYARVAEVLCRDQVHKVLTEYPANSEIIKAVVDGISHLARITDKREKIDDIVKVAAKYREKPDVLVPVMRTLGEALSY